MTPQEIEILIQQVQELIEQVRAETQKGGNTKERVANLLTKINEIMALINENSSGGSSNITLEIARQNGDVLEGNIFGDAEFDKQGDRKAFAQMSDVYDNAGGNITIDSTLKGNGTSVNPLGLSTSKINEILGKVDKTEPSTQSIVSNLAIGQTTADEKLHVNGRVKSNSLILNSNITASVNWEFGRKDGRVGYSDSTGIWKNLATEDDSKSKLIARYIRNENTEYYFSAFNYATGIGTTTVPHGIGATPVQVGIFPNNAKTLSDPSTFDVFATQIKAIPIEYLKANLYIKAVDANNLQLCTSAGVAITADPTSVENNNNLDFTKWHIENFQKLMMPALPVGYKNIRIIISGYSSSLKSSVMDWTFHTKNISNIVIIKSPFQGATALGGSGLVTWGGSSVNTNNTVFFQKMIDIVSEGGFGIGKCYAFNSYGRRSGQNAVYYDTVFGSGADFYFTLNNISDYNGFATLQFSGQASITTHQNLANGTIIEIYKI